MEQLFHIVTIRILHLSRLIFIIDKALNWLGGKKEMN